MIVEGLLRAGAIVHSCARSPDALAETEAALSGLGELHTFAGDVGSTEGCEAIRAEFLGSADRLHILVNNVGATARAPFEDYARADFNRVADINLAAPFDLTRVLLPELKAAASAGDPARVIHISSIGAFKLMQGVNNFAYSASKAGVMMLTRHMAAELRQYEINVNTIAPGLFESKLAGYMFDPGHPQYHTRPNIPIDRPGTAEDIVGGVIYLSSHAGSFVTGAMIPVSGGQSIIDWGR
jgi:NAD(P)-dependent dehydrogenase (short-subunit alcohol dehydrogenase family)